MLTSTLSIILRTCCLTGSRPIISMIASMCGFATPSISFRRCQSDLASDSFFFFFFFLSSSSFSSFLFSSSLSSSLSSSFFSVFSGDDGLGGVPIRVFNVDLTVSTTAAAIELEDAAACSAALFRASSSFVFFASASCRNLSSSSLFFFSASASCRNLSSASFLFFSASALFRILSSISFTSCSCCFNAASLSFASSKSF